MRLDDVAMRLYNGDTYIYTYKGSAMKRTNIMLGDDQHKKLKDYARREGRTLGELVREAIDSSYKRKDPLEERRRVALSAYQEGFISLGKLAEVLGLDPLSARNYLRERRILLRTQDVEELAGDAKNA
ncbi:MAG: hypothetical protein FJY83_10505 [Candidatus Aminicenantes bacterium]|nr:hypothetical protein [Candidatus Aminicenantes bacterium]